MQTPSDDGPPLLRMTGISKSFPGVKALENVDFAVGTGEIHAFLGENGAGKSTLLKILSGAQVPDSGTIALDGKPVVFATPQEAQRAGIVTIYQEFTLAPDMSIAENVFVGSSAIARWRKRRANCRSGSDSTAVPRRGCATWPWPSSRWWRLRGRSP